MNTRDLENKGVSAIFWLSGMLKGREELDAYKRSTENDPAKLRTLSHRYAVARTNLGTNIAQYQRN